MTRATRPSARHRPGVTGVSPSRWDCATQACTRGWSEALTTPRASASNTTAACAAPATPAVSAASSARSSDPTDGNSPATSFARGLKGTQPWRPGARTAWEICRDYAGESPTIFGAYDGHRVRPGRPVA